MRSFTHRTKDLFSSPSLSSRSSLILLNWEFPRRPLEIIWDCVTNHICADGAANRLLESNENSIRQLLPDFIHGDLDSLRPKTREFLERRGVQVIQNNDQESTDLDKCLELVQNMETTFTNGKQDQSLDSNEDGGDDKIFVLGAFGGRLDHEMANIDSALRWSNNNDTSSSNTLSFDTSTWNSSLTLLSEHSLAYVLSPGIHHIYPDFTLEGSTCGLIPLGTPCESITTTGLTWNLNNAKLEFGSLISTSNSIEKNAEKITITTSHSILWTTHINWINYEYENKLLSAAASSKL
jgi:thiamine pyrophosphokinase